MYMIRVQWTCTEQTILCKAFGAAPNNKTHNTENNNHCTNSKLHCHCHDMKEKTS